MRAPLIRAIVFDLGNVILTFDNRLIARRLARYSKAGEDAIYRFIQTDPLTRSLDAGRIAPEEYFDALRDRFSLSLAYRAFVPLWCAIFKPNPGIGRLIDHLKGRYRLGLLSNTNRLHFEYIRRRYPVINAIDDCFLSYELGRLKPAKEVYRRLSRRYGLPPGEIVFIDDIRRYADAASSTGLHGIHFVSVPLLRRELAVLGIGT